MIYQDHLSRLAEEKTLQSQYEAVKRENQQLSHQVNELEEKVQDMADRSEELQRDSRHKLDDMNREHDLQIQVRLWLLDSGYLLTALADAVYLLLSCIILLHCI